MKTMGDQKTMGRGGTNVSPVVSTAKIVGKKWHPLLVAELLENGPLGFNDLKQRVDGISDKVLSESLDDLQERDIVDRTVIDDKPVRVEYSLTRWGEQLELVVTAMAEWGERYLDAITETGKEQHR
ncbi:transcriptional regulator [Halobacteriales archaeon QS_4_62_28]|nr:MAG: transcriptional regulator [Halobacteriales archaeon QS_4_62_28]